MLFRRLSAEAMPLPAEEHEAVLFSSPRGLCGVCCGCADKGNVAMTVSGLIAAVQKNYHQVDRQVDLPTDALILKRGLLRVARALAQAGIYERSDSRGGLAGRYCWGGGASWYTRADLSVKHGGYDWRLT